jgi:integrase
MSKPRIEIKAEGKAASVRFHFTADALKRVAVPPGKPNVTVFDDEVKGLACRVSPVGSMTMIVYRKIAGVPRRETLGRFTPGVGRKTIAHWRTEAVKRLGEILDDPARYIERKADIADDAGKLTVQGAFAAALADSKRKSATARHDWERHAKPFLTWLRANCPHVATWAALADRHVRAYDATLKHLSPNARRLRLQPIKQVGRFMEREHGIPNVVNVRLSSELVQETPSVDVGDVADFCNYLRDNAPWLEAGVSLQGLAGLRLLEALRLRWRDVRLADGLILVGAEIAKTKFSKRVIPVCARVSEALCRAYDRVAARGPVDLAARVVGTARGLPYMRDETDRIWSEYGRTVSAALRAWNARVKWRAKDLRNALAQAATLGGWDGSLFELYIGHVAPGDVTKRHYVGQLATATPGDERRLAETMGRFRAMVTNRIDAAIAAHGSGARAKVESVRGGS